MTYMKAEETLRNLKLNGIGVASLSKDSSILLEIFDNINDHHLKNGDIYTEGEDGEKLFIYRKASNSVCVSLGFLFEINKLFEKSTYNIWLKLFKYIIVDYYNLEHPFEVKPFKGLFFPTG